MVLLIGLGILNGVRVLVLTRELAPVDVTGCFINLYLLQIPPLPSFRFPYEESKPLRKSDSPVFEWSLMNKDNTKFIFLSQGIYFFEPQLPLKFPF